MTKLLAQHGPAKGRKITVGLEKGNIFGAIFSPNDESIDSIYTYVTSTETLNRSNVFIDPQFYYSTFDSTILKKLGEIDIFPSNIARRDWRKKSDKILNYINYHAKKTKLISDTLITPGFYIDNIDWRFDYSIDIYNYCIEKFDFINYALSLLVNTSLFANKANVDEMVDEIDEICIKKDYIYLILCHEGNIGNNYEEMDTNSLGNILYFIYQLQKSGFKFIMGYSFMNSILFSMLGCEYVSSGWFNTLRKFQKNRLELIENFGRRKKRYTSIPLLTYMMIDDYKIMRETGKISELDFLSGSVYDKDFIEGEDLLSFVDLEHQYWESLSKAFTIFDSTNNISERIIIMRRMIKNALATYKEVIDELDLRDEKEASNRIKSASKHLVTWLASIDIFKANAMIL